MIVVIGVGHTNFKRVEMEALVLSALSTGNQLTSVKHEAAFLQVGSSSLLSLKVVESGRKQKNTLKFCQCKGTVAIDAFDQASIKAPNEPSNWIA